MHSLNSPGLHVAIAMSFSLVGAPAFAADGDKKCDVETFKAEQLTPLLKTAIADTSKVTRCSSFKRILSLVIRKPVTGGRKLEDDKPLNIPEAEQQLAEARGNAEFTSALAVETEGETDATRRLLLETVVLHDKGYLKARDLQITKLRAGVVN